MTNVSTSIDIETEARIMRLIRGKLQKKTLLSILHRLETALDYDRVLIMEQGKLIHSGPPSEVVLEANLFSSLREQMSI